MNLTHVTDQVFEIKVPISINKLLYQGLSNLLCHSNYCCPTISEFEDVHGQLLCPFFLFKN